MEKEEIKRLVLEEDLNLTDVIDVVVEMNCIIGVGLITLSDGVSEYILDKINKNISFD